MFGIDMGSIKPSILNAFMIAAIVIITIPMIKFAANKYPIPGFTALVNAV